MLRFEYPAASAAVTVAAHVSGSEWPKARRTSARQSATSADTRGGTGPSGKALVSVALEAVEQNGRLGSCRGVLVAGSRGGGKFGEGSRADGV